MSLREEFLQIKTKEEFKEKREKFRELKFDKELIEHESNLFGECYVGGDIENGLIEEVYPDKSGHFH
ncbi:MAG: hypothetical protein IKJ01_01955 [Lachnospiraceae bacterium]|nr:hypothetical protein [Lachnospiraceae bacterium]